MSKKGVDLVLIHPGHRTRIYQALGKELSGVETPVWAGLFATFMLKKGFSVQIIDGEAENIGPDQIARKIKDINPVLAAVVVYGHQPSASTQNMTVASEIATAIKNENSSIPTIMVGGHVASLPMQTMQDEPDTDFIAGGEGIYTLLDLVQALKAGDKNYSKVRGLWWREDGEVKSNPVPPLLMNVNEEMPGIAWDLLPMSEYRAHNWHCFGDLERQPYAAMYTTLGCPFHCTFCCIQAPFKGGEKAAGMNEAVNSYRFWSPQVIGDQLEILTKKYGVRNLRISDEMFVLNNKHVHGICDMIIERGYKLNMWAYARVDTIKGEGTLAKLKKAGFNWLCLGIESASDRVKNDVDKGYTEEDLYRVVKDIQAAGINIIANYIFGLPEDDMASMQATLDQSMDLNCEFANFYSGMAYPGSELYNLALKEKWELPKEWTGYSQHSVDMLPLRTKHLTAAEVIRFRDHAWQTYFTNPKYLNMIQKKFGQKTVDHIKGMTAHKLVREFAK